MDSLNYKFKLDVSSNDMGLRLDEIDNSLRVNVAAQPIIEPKRTSQLINDSDFVTDETVKQYISEIIEEDPTVPSYVKDISSSDIDNWNNKSDFSGNYEDLNGIPDPYDDTELRELVDGKADKEHTHSQYLTEHQSLADYVKTNDSRLTDSRTPKAHKHDIGDIENFPEIPIDEIQANTYARHIHSNQGILDRITKMPITEHQDISGKADKVHTHPEYLTEHQDISGKADINHTHPGYATEAWVENQHYLTKHQSLAGYVTTTDERLSDARVPLEHTHTKDEISGLPTKLSELINDTAFITNAVNDLTNYYKKSEVNELVDGLPKFGFSVVDELPTENISSTTIYLKTSQNPEDGNIYEEYIHVNGKWELLGAQDINLEGYATEEFVTSQGYLKSYTETDPTVPAWAKTANKPTYSYAEITNKPTEFTAAPHNHPIDEIVSTADASLTDSDSPKQSKKNFYLNAGSPGNEIGYSGWDIRYYDVSGCESVLIKWSYTSNYNGWYRADGTYISNPGAIPANTLMRVSVPADAAILGLSNQASAFLNATVQVSAESIVEVLNNKAPKVHSHPEYLTEHQSLANYVQTTDSRLTNARTPLAHSHTMSEISDYVAPAGRLIQVTYNVSTGDEIQAILDAGNMPFVIYGGNTYYYQDISYDNYYRFVSITPGSSNTSDPPITKRLYKQKVSGVGGWGSGTITLFSTTHKPAWGDVTGKPTTFTPSSHSHTKADISDFAHKHNASDINSFSSEVTSVLSAMKIGQLSTADSSLQLYDDRIAYDLDNLGTGVLALDRDIPTDSHINDLIDAKLNGIDTLLGGGF